jgi:hypothetical protein
MPFNRDEMARWHAKQQFKIDPGARAVYYLPEGAPEREIRLLEVNDEIIERAADSLEPIDFGVDTDSPNKHVLLFLDITPAQWEQLQRGELRLPAGWRLDGAKAFARESA